MYLIYKHFYRPSTKFREGNVFSRLSACSGGGSHVTITHDALDLTYRLPSRHLVTITGDLFKLAVVVPKCFIKHMCLIVLYFHGHAFFSLEIAKKCFFVLYFLKNVLYFCKLFKWMEYLFQVFIYNTKIGEL